MAQSQELKLSLSKDLEYKKARIIKAYKRLLSVTNEDQCIAQSKQFCIIMLKAGYTPTEVLKLGLEMLSYNPYVKDFIDPGQLEVEFAAMVDKCLQIPFVKSFDINSSNLMPV